MSFQSIEQSFLSRVKLLPWAQFAFTSFAYLGLLVFALNGGHGFWAGVGKLGVFFGALIAFVAFIVELVHNTSKFVNLQHLLQVVGFAAALILGIELRNGFVVLAFVALAVTQAGQWFDEIYP